MKKYLFSIVLAVFMLCVVTASAEAATYYVAKTGLDFNSCTIATEGGSDSTKAKLTV